MRIDDENTMDTVGDNSDIVTNENKNDDYNVA